MDRYCRNIENDDHYNMYGIRKKTYWEKYGVQRFPYHGKRRYTPYINQSFDGGIEISNDVFGLTIKQFEQTYKKCLQKRKEHEHWILNLRYPDKSSKEYLEFLQDCTYYNKDFPWPGNDTNDFEEKYLYELLVNTVGTEIDIRTRQRLFIISDLINNEDTPDETVISSGSLAEGLDLPGSDQDIMIVKDTITVVRNVRNIKYPIQGTTLVMETDTEHPGFARLRLITEVDDKFTVITSEIVESTREGLYVSASSFLNQRKQDLEQSLIQLYLHGPCLSNEDHDTDLAFCFRSKYFPYQAMPWAFRHRKQWPPNNVTDRIINYGCLLVPIGPTTVSNSHLLWRLSFSMAEKQLVHSFNFTQLLCYGLLKLILKRIIDKNDDVKELLCSYFLKTALFWVSEEVDIDTFQLHRLFFCFSLCLKKLLSWVNNCYCPNFFVPEHNMFLGKITQNNNEKLLHVLGSILSDGMDRLIKNLFPRESQNYSLLSTDIETSLIKVDFLFYRIGGFVKGTVISSCYKLMTFIESLLTSESSPLNVGVCKYQFAIISQQAAQLLTQPTTNIAGYSLQNLYRIHLLNGTKTDAVSGWLLYASFYYVTGQYMVALKLTDYVLFRSTPDMVYIDTPYNENDINNYKRHVHNSVTLNAKMKIATVSNVTYTANSSLIPLELQLDVENDKMDIPPIVMTHCLRFLCYHNLGDNFNRQEELRDLHLTVQNRYFIAEEAFANSITILGVCYEISGDKDTALWCYDEALQCNYMCSAAETRKSKLC